MPQPAGPDLFEVLSALEKQGAQEVAAVWHSVLAEVSINRAKTFAAKTSANASATSATHASNGVSRTSEGILVSSKALVMQVLLDREGNYSTQGYNERAAASIGPIYLGLDWGPEYNRQSAQANAAIQAITRKQAFDQAWQETRLVMAALPDPADFDIQAVSDSVLAALCLYWFDLPDGKFVEAGGWRLLNLLGPARCPGDFSPPSGYIFHPDPGLVLTLVGRRIGELLRASVGGFVASRRDIANLPRGSLARAMFAAFPISPDDDDLVARLIIGAMMGMLPTIDGNLTATVRTWQQDGTFDILKNAWKSSAQKDVFLRSGALVAGPMMQAMQKAPTPDAVWRSAVKEHVLGDVAPVNVHVGDKIFISIVDATHEDLAAQRIDVCPIFGGARGQSPHPLHACPGMEMALGILLGIICGVLEPQAVGDA